MRKERGKKEEGRKEGNRDEEGKRKKKGWNEGIIVDGWISQEIWIIMRQYVLKNIVRVDMYVRTYPLFSLYPLRLLLI